MFGLAQSQKMDGKSFCRNFLDLVWFSAYVVRREIGVSLELTGNRGWLGHEQYGTGPGIRLSAKEDKFVQVL